ncbi:HD domain-containing protein [Micromonospora viridifaciens]|uniref:HD domain-containing protein n=1 Tax=Micromonospora viridifaciens TaxID=1881 RepID=UPI00142E12BA|nr:HD domain-containing protein [Micromonospora viridifaciens]
MDSGVGSAYTPHVALLSLEAAEVAERHLSAALPRRWRHVQAVAAKARRLSPLVGPDSDLLVASAWLHDVGYAPGIIETGFHSLDGARWALQNGFNERLASLIAYHSCAEYEANERGLGEVLASEFSYEESPTSDALWFADMTTGPDGQNLAVEDRLAEIRERYGPEHLVTRLWHRTEPALMASIRRTQARMAAQPM